MNPAVFLPPAAALFVVAIWIGPQRAEIVEIERENDILKAHIDAARLSRSPESDRSLAARLQGKPDAKDKRIDWMKFAEMQAGMQGGIPDMRAMVELQKNLLGMSADELAAALDEIAALELSAQVKQQLEVTLLGVLAQKDPKLALDRFAERIGDDDGGVSWQLAHALGRWSAKDSAGAAAWMDRMIAAGKFDSKSLDGKSPSRLRFEAALVKELLATDPDAAARRIEELPEDQRADLFNQGMFFNLRAGGEKAMAELIRGSVPEDEQADTLAKASSGLVRQGGYEKVGAFLADIAASGEERAAIVSDAIRTQIANGPELKTSMEETRAWILAQAPDDAERLTGEALGHMAEWQDFPDLAEQALAYQESSGRDDALVAFLEHRAARNHRDQALPLVEKVSDPAERERLLKWLGGGPQPSTRATTVK